MTGRRAPRDEPAWPAGHHRAVWLGFALVLLVAAALIAVSVWWQWAACRPDRAAAACTDLKASVGMLPLQARVAAVRVPTALPPAVAAQTALLLGWVLLLVALPFARGIRRAGAILAGVLAVTTIAAWSGVADPTAWYAHTGVWITLGVVGEFAAALFLVYAITASRQTLPGRTVQRLVVAAAAVTAFGAIHQSSEFIVVGAFDPQSTGAPRYLGLGTAVWLSLCAVAVVVLTFLKPTRDRLA